MYGSAWVYDELPCRAEYLKYFQAKLQYHKEKRRNGCCASNQKRSDR